MVTAMQQTRVNGKKSYISSVTSRLYITCYKMYLKIHGLMNN